MTYRFVFNRTLLMLSLSTLATCAHGPAKKGGAVTSQTSAGNPLLGEFRTPFGVPPFDAIKTEHFLPAVNAGMKEQLHRVVTIADETAPPTFENTIAALDFSGMPLARTVRIFRGLHGAETNDALDEVAKTLTPLLTAHTDRILLDAKLFARVKSVYDARATLSLTIEQQTLLRETYTHFVRAGAELDAAQKKKLEGINKELASSLLRFGQNVRKENNAFALVIEKKSDLAGLPVSVVDAAAKAASDKGQAGKWIFTLHKPSLLPFLSYSARRELREKLFKAYIRRGANGDALDNSELIKKIVALRIEKAKMLGAKNWAAFALDNRMAKTPEAVEKLLDRVWQGAIPAAKREVAAMQAVIVREEKPPFELAPWDWWYYAEKVRQEKYAFDDSALRPYFALDNVITGAFSVAKKLYGLSFEQRKDLPVYHREVKTYEVKEADGKHLGLLYVDYFPRPGKRGGAWCGGFREHVVFEGKELTPVITNVGNFTRPTATQPSLLSMEEVRTLFHEFGHALHALLNKTVYPSSADDIKVDFVELPSQIMENWATEPEVLRSYAKHYESGKAIPKELIDKLQKASHFNQGFATVEYLAASYLDLGWHQLESVHGVEVAPFSAEAMKKRGLIAEIVPRYTSTNFQHIFSSSYYAAGYYSYLWSEVLDADAFAHFKARGIFDPETARAFRALLESGGGEDPMTLYKRFRGQEPKVEPLLRRRGLL